MTSGSLTAQSSCSRLLDDAEQQDHERPGVNQAWQGARSQAAQAFLLKLWPATASSGDVACTAIYPS